MAAAGALSIAGIGVPFVEIGIAVSVIILGTIVAFDLKAPTAAAMGVVGLFAVFTVTPMEPKFRRMLAGSLSAS